MNFSQILNPPKSQETKVGCKGLLEAREYGTS